MGGSFVQVLLDLLGYDPHLPWAVIGVEENKSVVGIIEQKFNKIYYFHREFAPVDHQNYFKAAGPRLLPFYAPSHY